jgi:hypothetical protein
LVIWGVVRRKTTAGEVCDPADVAQRLEDQADRFPTTRRAAVDADVSGGSKELGLRPGLPGDRCRG